MTQAPHQAKHFSSKAPLQIPKEQCTPSSLYNSGQLTLMLGCKITDPNPALMALPTSQFTPFLDPIDTSRIISGPPHHSWYDRRPQYTCSGEALYKSLQVQNNLQYQWLAPMLGQVIATDRDQHNVRGHICCTLGHQFQEPVPEHASLSPLLQCHLCTKAQAPSPTGPTGILGCPEHIVVATKTNSNSGLQHP